jgi:hypothetical protein
MCTCKVTSVLFMSADANCVCWEVAVRTGMLWLDWEVQAIGRWREGEGVCLCLNKVSETGLIVSE